MILPSSTLGWTDALERAFQSQAEGRLAARIIAEHRSEYVVATDTLESRAVLSGRLRSDEAESHPGVGDWVAVDEQSLRDGLARIEAVLPRRTAVVRRAAGEEARAQVVAANVDTVFIATALPADLNARRLERYLALVWESGASPVVVLTKVDLCDDLASALAEVEAIAPGVPIIAVSQITGEGLDELSAFLLPGQTVAVMGSSGVGKSTLINRWLQGEALVTGELGADGRGRHTTTSRSLLVLPSGAFVIDTPGMREVGMLGGEEGIEQTFADVSDFAAQCHFADCAHQQEPGCAVLEAVSSGVLTEERYESYLKLRREAAAFARRTDEVARGEAKKHARVLSRALRAHLKTKR